MITVVKLWTENVVMILNRIFRPAARAFAFSAACLLFLAAAAWGQIAVTQPAAKDTVKAASDYATEVLNDRWDMNERTDLGWTIFNVDELPSPHLSDIAFAGGLFSATTVLSDPTNGRSDAIIPILDSSYTGSAHVGKFGNNYPINADRYTHFLLRMYMDPEVIDGLAVPAASSVGQFFWSTGTIYDGSLTWSNFFPVSGGWVFYEIDIPALGVLGGASVAWAGNKGSLRFDPTVVPDLDIAIDWIRLVSNEAVCYRTITWTEAGSVDLYLDDDANAANGNLGLLKKGATGTSYAFLAGGLAPGNYYVALTTDEGASFSYSTGYYEVTEQPIAVFTKPSAEGSDQDFATVIMGNPWDFTALSDIDLANNVNDAQIKTNFTYEDLAGNVHTGNTVYSAKANIPAAGWGDPQVFFLSAAYRGKNYTIDPVRYHNLVAKMGIYGNHSTATGSVARVFYMRTDQHWYENVSQDIVIRHKAGGYPVMHKIVTDLKTLILEEGGASPSHSGWTGIIDSFRIDPHEFKDGREFFYDDVRITADWKADASFTIEWTADAPAGTTMSLWRDTDTSDFNGTKIADVSYSSGSYVWDTSGVTGGTYHLYAVLSSNGGININKVYATGPLIIDHSIPPAIGLSRTRLNFTKIKGGRLTPVEKVTLSNTGDGVLTWTAAASEKWISVMPKSGNGAATLSIKIVNVLAIPVGSYTGTVRVTCPTASNSPQVINIYLTVKAPKTDAVPFGVFDLPAGSTAAFGTSIRLGGWALDDVAMQAVKIFRQVTPTTKKLIGKATFVAGARPGVERDYPGYPQNYKAGWTYTLNASQLPNAGKGTFTIKAYAFDTGGHNVLLGTKTLTGTGATAAAGGETVEISDAPADGATVSGSVQIILPGEAAADGRAPTVWLDGLAMGHPEYDGLQGSTAFTLDTTALAEGWHTLAWNADAGGIESRYVRIRNEAAFDENEVDGDASPVVANPIKTARPFEEIGAIPEDVWSAVYIKRGFDEETPAERIYPEEGGAVRINMAPSSRLAVYLGLDEAFEGEAAGKARIQRILKDAKNPPEFRRFDAYALIGEQLRDLPIGASFDGRAGVLTWQPGPGFVGEYVFVFVTNDGANPTRKTIVITVLPE